MQPRAQDFQRFRFETVIVDASASDGCGKNCAMCIGYDRSVSLVAP
jgi:hypothetical protein